jgi:competence protein ComEC
MNLTANPFVRIIFPFALGVVLSQIREHQSMLNSFGFWFLCIPLFGLLTAAVMRFRFKWSFIYGVCLFFVLLVWGYLRAYVHDERNALAYKSIEKISSEQEVTLLGVICDAPSTGKKLKTPFQIEAVLDDEGDTISDLAARAMIFWPIDSTSRQFQYGDRLMLRARLSAVSPPLNPHAFDYSRYLHFQNIHLQAFAHTEDAVRLSRRQGVWLWSKAFQARDRLLGTLKRHFGEGDEYAVASALLVGYKDDLSDEIKTAYAETGSMHALAVSGTHVGLLYMGLMLLLGRIPWSGKKKRSLDAVMVFAAIWAFAFLTGATASVLRATIMFSVFLVGQVAHRHITVWNSLGVSAFGLLLYNPFFLFDPGFQLSYAAVAGMAFFYQRMLKVSPYIPNRWLSEGYKVMLVGVAAQIGTLPLSLYYFHQFPTYFWLAGWVVVLGGAVFLWLGALLIVLDGLWPWLATYLGKLLLGMVWAMNEAIILIQRLPGSLISGVWIEAWETLLLYGVIGSFAILLVSRQKKWLWAALGGLTLIVAHQAWVKIKACDQEKVFVYAASKEGRLFDFVDGRTVFALGDTTLTEQSKKYLCQSNRWACRADCGDTTQMPFQQGFIGDRCWYRYPMAQSDTTRFLLIDDARVVPALNGDVHFDVVVISQSPKIDIKTVCDRFTPKVVVFDASNSRKYVARLGAVCAEAGVRVHDVRSVGCFVWGE